MNFILHLSDVRVMPAAIFAADCSPHWGSPQFLEWPSYQRLWDNLVRWTASKA
jgi:uncharacterized membrane protein